MEKINVLCVDDHVVIRKGIRFLLKEIEFVETVFEAENGKVSLELLNIHKVDIVLMDIRMPVMNGIEATREAMVKYPKLKIIAFSMFEEIEQIKDMIQAGVKGYISKSIKIYELKEALLSVLKGNDFYSKNVSYLMNKEFANKCKEFANIPLTTREKDVLCLICRGYTNHEIAKNLNINHKTVQGHRANLIKKYGVKNSLCLALHAVKNSIVSV